jgi:PAS domain-containing protein
MRRHALDPSAHVHRAIGPDVPQHPIELILLRQLASYLTTPMFLVDAEARLLYYNEAAEALLGQPFPDATEMPRDAWLEAFAPRAPDGRPLEDANPLSVALAARQEQHASVVIRSLDGHDRRVEVTAVPLEGQAGRLLGAVAIFWPADTP